MTQYKKPVGCETKTKMLKQLIKTNFQEYEQQLLCRVRS